MKEPTLLDIVRTFERARIAGEHGQTDFYTVSCSMPALPCPFCGCQARTSWFFNHRFNDMGIMECPKCGATLTTSELFRLCDDLATKART